MTKLFLPFSTYHILLSYAIAAENYDEDNIMILGDSSLRMQSTIEIFQAIFPNIFCNIIYLTPTSKVNNLKAYILKKKNIHVLGDYINPIKNNITDFYYACEWNVYTTYISNYLKRSQHNHLTYHFIEDGIATYVEANLKTKSLLEQVVDYVLYGRWHTSCSIHGGLNNNATVNAIFPNLLPSTYSIRTKEEIKYKSLISRLRLDSLPGNFANSLIPNVNLLIALDSVGSYSMTTYATLIRTHILKPLQSGLTVAIKRHPADSENTALFDTLSLPKEVIDLPAFLPIEFYYLFFYSSLQEIIGGLSTAIMTARWLIPHADVMSTFSKSEINITPNVPQIFNIFNKIGISVELI